MYSDVCNTKRYEKTSSRDAVQNDRTHDVDGEITREFSASTVHILYVFQTNGRVRRRDDGVHVGCTLVRRIIILCTCDVHIIIIYDETRVGAIAIIVMVMMLECILIVDNVAVCRDSTLRNSTIIRFEHCICLHAF